MMKERQHGPCSNSDEDQALIRMSRIVRLALDAKHKEQRREEKRA